MKKTILVKCKYVEGHETNKIKLGFFTEVSEKEFEDMFRKKVFEPIVMEFDYEE